MFSCSSNIPFYQCQIRGCDLLQKNQAVVFYGYRMVEQRAVYYDGMVLAVFTASIYTLRQHLIDVNMAQRLPQPTLRQNVIANTFDQAFVSQIQRFPDGIHPIHLP